MQCCTRFRFIKSPISIHAPARGASAALMSALKYLISISIHAPARGASFCSYFLGASMYFNSRPCERGFENGIFAFHSRRNISIHAPARGASCTQSSHQNSLHISIHAPARGASLLLFHDLLLRTHFNSRPCERGFWVCRHRLNHITISIHAPARGASYCI